MFRVATQRVSHLHLSRPSSSGSKRTSTLRGDFQHPLRPGHSSHARARSSTRQALSRRVFSSTKRSEISIPMGISTGGLAGVMAALSGVGGGMILVPTLAKVTELPIQIIRGTCTGALMVSAGVGAWNYYQVDAYNFPLVVIIAIPSLVFARVGAFIARRLTGKQLSKLGGLGMLAAVPCIVLRANQLSNEDREDNATTNRDCVDLQYYNSLKFDRRQVVMALMENPVNVIKTNAHYSAAGAVAGLISGLCGTGGGIATATYLMVKTEMPQPEIIGTTLIGTLPSALTATFFNYRAKSIHIPTAFKVGVSVAAGVHVTNRLIFHYEVPESYLRAALSTSLGVAAVTMFRRSL